MKFIRGLHNFKKALPASVVTLGNFDGMHLGHQALLQAVTTMAAQKNLASVVILFEPQPREYFQVTAAVPRLMRLREKLLALQQQGIDYCVCLYFKKTLAQMSADTFVKTILQQRCHVDTVIVGDDFRFGAQRMGDVNFLKQFNFNVVQLGTVLNGQQRMSSTLVREALQAGEIKQATSWLGHPYVLIGKVAHGDKRGRELGFPTANIFLHRKAVPLSGIYAVKVRGINNSRIYNACAYVGTRPVFNGKRVIMEVHVLDFTGNLYGKNLEVEFLHKIRDDAAFDSIAALVSQIEHDIRATRAYFSVIG